MYPKAVFWVLCSDIVEEFGDFLSFCLVKLFADDVKMYVVMDDVKNLFFFSLAWISCINGRLNGS